MLDYQNGKIYTIRCYTDSTLIYVGSTRQEISQRWTDHKKIAKNQNHSNNMKLYQVMRDKGIDNFYIELYEEHPCENRAQLGKREGEIIREIGTLNKQIPGRTNCEYKQEYLTQFKEYYDSYYATNNEQIKEQKKEVIICECGCKTNRGHISRHKKTSKHLALMASKESQ